MEAVLISPIYSGPFRVLAIGTNSRRSGVAKVGSPVAEFHFRDDPNRLRGIRRSYMDLCLSLLTTLEDAECDAGTADPGGRS